MFNKGKKGPEKKENALEGRLPNDNLSLQKNEEAIKGTASEKGKSTKQKGTKALFSL